MLACQAYWDLSGNLYRKLERSVSLSVMQLTQIVVPDAGDTKEAEVQRLCAHGVIFSTALRSYFESAAAQFCK